MNFDKPWTQLALEAEYEEFGFFRIVKTHNEQIASYMTLVKQLTKANEQLKEQLDQRNQCKLPDKNC